MVLTKNEKTLLNKIARRTNMNCWFSLVRGEQSGRPADAVFDLELGRPISLRKGITDLLEGMTDDDIKELTHEEATEMLILIRKVI